MNTVVRSGRLTWAQDFMWRRVFWRRFGEPFPVDWVVWTLAEPIAVDRVRAALSALVRRHEILRTHFALGPDGMPRQIVASADAFRIPVSVVECAAADADDPPREGFDPAGTLWSMRLLVDGVDVRRIGVHAEHLMFDMFGLRAWRAQLIALAHDPDDRCEVTQPIDMAQAEPDLESGAVRDAYARHRAALRAVPQVLLPARPLPRQQSRYLFSRVTYRGHGRCLEEVAHRLRSTRPAVMAYVIGWMLARLARQSVLPVGLLYANRADGSTGISCQMRSVDMITTFTAGDAPRTGVRRMLGHFMSAIDRNALPPHLSAQARAAASAQTGTHIKKPVLFNFRLRGPNEIIPGSHDVQGLEVADQWSDVGEPYCNEISVDIEDGSFVVEFDVDTALIGAADVEAMRADLLPTLERMIAAPDRPLGQWSGWRVSPFVVRSGLVAVGPNWLDVRSLESLIRQFAGVRSVEIVCDDREVTAIVVAESGLTAADIHDHVLSQLAIRTDLVAPTRYVLNGATSDPGRPDRKRARSSEENALRQAFLVTHGRPPDSLDQSFVAAGGRVALGPAFVTAVERLGYGGLTSIDLVAPRPLSGLACQLRRV